MKKIFTLSQLVFAAALFLAASRCWADDGSRIPRQRENRFLFVVDTSSAMRGYAGAVVQTVGDLLTTDMRGELRQGDTIGLWLYNDKLDTQYPMEVWSKADRDAVADDMTAFLRGRPYEKQAHLEKVMPVLNQVIKSSQRVTVILIFDGSGAIQGTPFDKDIHTLQKKYARELRAAHVPFVTVLTARDGAVYDYTINYPGSIAIPHTANPEKPVETNAPVAPAAAIVTPPVTNAPVKPRQPSSIIMSRAPVVIQPAPAAPAPVAPPETTSATFVIVPAPPRAAPVPPPPPVAATAAPAVPVVPVSQPAVVTATPPAASAVATSQPAIVAAVPAPREAAPPTPPVSSPISVTANDLPPSAPAPPVAPTAPVAAISPAGGAPLTLFIAAFVLLTFAVVLVVFLVRRSRGAPQPSLISQSIDRPR